MRIRFDLTGDLAAQLRLGVISAVGAGALLWLNLDLAREANQSLSPVQSGPAPLFEHLTDRTLVRASSE